MMFEMYRRNHPNPPREWLDPSGDVRDRVQRAAILGGSCTSNGNPGIWSKGRFQSLCSCNKPEIHVLSETFSTHANKGELVQQQGYQQGCLFTLKAVSYSCAKWWRRGELNPSSYRDEIAVRALYERNMNKFISLRVGFNRSKKNVRLGEI